MTRRGLLAGVLALGLLLVAVPSASASFHIMKIREVSGGAAASGLSYVELQMYTSFQNYIDGHSIAVYDADGQTDGDAAVDPVEECVLDGILPNTSLSGDNQRTILVGDTSVTGADAVCDQADDLDPLEAGGVAAASGAVCFSDGSPPDCASWGSFAGGPTSISFDNPAPFGGALPTDDTNALKRKISGGSCATLLDFSDDTDDTNADFEAVPRDPTPNNVAPIETPCTSQPIPPGGGSTTPAAPAPAPKKKKKCKKSKKRSAGAAAKKCKKKKK